jgi:phosphatidylethanolamine/phosphatidyl-N-methylethanolamine N-methyltransferase
VSGADLALMVREFVRSPTTVGAVAPSSARLAKAVVAPIPECGQPVVVELGCGTGAFTGAIQARLDGRGRHIAVELNPRLAALTARRYPGVEVVHGSAEHLVDILDSRGVRSGDAVISGLPWASFPGSLQKSILDQVATVTASSGAFTTFGYVGARQMLSARRFQRMLAERFEEIVTGRVVWLNLPPACVYYARRPGAEHRLQQLRFRPADTTSTRGAGSLA